MHYGDTQTRPLERDRDCPPNALHPESDLSHSTLALGWLHIRLHPSWLRSSRAAALSNGYHPNYPRLTGGHVEALRSSYLPKLTQQAGGRAWIRSWVWVTLVTKNTGRRAQGSLLGWPSI